MVYDNICLAAKKSGLSINFIEIEAGLSAGSLCKWNKVSPTARSLKEEVSHGYGYIFVQVLPVPGTLCRKE